MKLLFKPLLLVACLLAVAGCPAPQPVTPPSNIIARLPFDGNLVDSTGHHHDATAVGPVTYGPDRFGHAGKALVLNGQTRLTVHDSSDLHFTGASSFTISSWIKTNDTSDAGIFCKGPANNGVPGYRLALKGGYPQTAITATGRNVNLVAPHSVADNKWHLVTMTVSPKAVYLYIDSTEVAKQLGPHLNLRPDSLNTLAPIIGGFPGGTGGSRMWIDHTTVFGIALSRAQIIIRMGPWPGMPGPTVMSDWPPGVTLPSNDSTVLGMRWVSSASGYCCGSAGMLRHWSNGSWSQLSTGVAVALHRIDIWGTQVIVVGHNATVLKVDAAGTVSTPSISFVTPTGYTGPAVTVGTVHFLDIRFLDANHLVAVGELKDGTMWRGVVLTSSLSASSWTLQPINGTGNPYTDAPMYCLGKANSSTVYAGGGNGEVYKGVFTAGSWLWLRLTLPPPTIPANSPSTINAVTACDFDISGNGVMVTDGGEIFNYDGSNWSLLANSNTSALYTAVSTGIKTYTLAGDGVILKDDATGTTTPGTATNSDSTPWVHLAKAGTYMYLTGNTYSPNQITTVQ
jgi:hypothetical protein